MRQGNREGHLPHDLSKEEEPNTQRFSVVVIWSPGSADRIGPDDVQRILRDAVAEIDPRAAVQVAEIAEPLY